MLQAGRERRANPEDLANTYVRGGNGALIPLSNLVTLSEIAEPGSLNRFNRLRAITLSAGLVPGYTLGEALDWMRQAAAEELPDTAQIDFKGESREFQKAGGAVAFTFAMALLIVFLVLAAQFESFVHPLVIMLTVPLAVLGALLGLWLWGSSLNLFSQIGIVMLVGLAAKNGILIVEFANQLRDRGEDVRSSIEKACALRLRPVMMTMIATILGGVPLVFAHGAGAEARIALGWVIVGGLGFATLVTLFITPVAYLLLARFAKPHAHEEARLHEEMSVATRPRATPDDEQLQAAE
jgi:multidrug efflux pump